MIDEWGWNDDDAWESTILRNCSDTGSKTRYVVPLLRMENGESCKFWKWTSDDTG